MGGPVGAADHDPVAVDQHVLERGVEVRERGPVVGDRPAVLPRPDDAHVEAVVADEPRGQERLGLVDVALVPDFLEEATYRRPQLVIGHVPSTGSRRRGARGARSCQ